MIDTLRSAARLEASITAWSGGRPDIRAALVMGSRARTDRPADAYSDIDIALVTTSPSHYLGDAAWLDRFGERLLTFLEPTSSGRGRERRVLFADGLDADFVPIGARALRRALAVTRLRLRHPGAYRLLPTVARQAPEQLGRDFIQTARRGFRFLVDKDGFAARIARLLPLSPASGAPPTEAEFLEVVYDYLYHAVWTWKKLQRRELWAAKACLDAYMKRLLLRMLEWHAASRGTPAVDTWHAGRFLEEWADPGALEGLETTFTRYAIADVRRGIDANLRFFASLGAETAAALRFRYPEEPHRQVERLLADLDRMASSGAGDPAGAPEPTAGAPR